MAFGILEPKASVGNVPGTTFLDVHDQAAVDNYRLIKKGTGRNAHVVLVPHSSNDPNDSLNWPLWQRDLLLVLLTVCTLVTVGGFGPIPSPIAVTLITEFQIDFTQVSLLSGYCLSATGAVGIFMAACCRKFGKRSALLFSMTCAFIGCIWAGAAKSYGSLIGARALQGMSMAFFESVMFAVIGDMYYVHERDSGFFLHRNVFWHLELADARGRNNCRIFGLALDLLVDVHLRWPLHFAMHLILLGDFLQP
ncbi:major facilitator superfamily domain-containing protein [Aspergillus cavernicola]|uniref:Major facilitator superfamily domain-containing protein n=1 Tax=Aspergillus cavernicola TaxID=176166 RepID=A0ABR4HWN7_9EURO